MSEKKDADPLKVWHVAVEKLGLARERFQAAQKVEAAAWGKLQNIRNDALGVVPAQMVYSGYPATSGSYFLPAVSYAGRL